MNFVCIISAEYEHTCVKCDKNKMLNETYQTGSQPANVVLIEIMRINIFFHFLYQSDYNMVLCMYE